MGGLEGDIEHSFGGSLSSLKGTSRMMYSLTGFSIQVWVWYYVQVVAEVVLLFTLISFFNKN